MIFSKRIRLVGLLLLCILLFAVNLCAYTVKKGDSISKIAKEHNVTIGDLIKSNNGLTEESILHIGQELIIPGKTSHFEKNSSVSGKYIVVKGDTLYSISKKVGISLNTLKKLNGFSDSSKLKIGQSVKLTASYGTNNFQKAQIGDKKQDIVKVAMSLRGSRYVRGGTSRGGFDCSGFTNYVYSQFGIKIPRTAATQATAGHHVNKSELQNGDLVLFAIRGSRVDHVGLYIGGDQFVHAANPQKGVIVSSLSGSYYKTHYVGARRIK